MQARYEEDDVFVEPAAPGPEAAPPATEPEPAPATAEPQIDEPQGGEGFEPPAAAAAPMVEQLLAAQGVGGTFQKAGTEGAAQLRTPDFYRDRQTGPPVAAGSVGSGTPFVGGAAGAGGERDDESAIFNAMRRAKKFR